MINPENLFTKYNCCYIVAFFGIMKKNGKGENHMFCEKCGKNIPDNSNNCTFCGAPQKVQGGAANQNVRNSDQTITAPILTFGDYLIMMIIAAIPIVNIVMLCMWGFGSDANPNKKNCAKAMLVFIIIVFILGMLFFSSLIALFISLSTF